MSPFSGEIEAADDFAEAWLIEKRLEEVVGLDPRHPVAARFVTRLEPTQRGVVFAERCVHLGERPGIRRVGARELFGECTCLGRFAGEGQALSEAPGPA